MGDFIDPGGAEYFRRPGRGILSSKAILKMNATPPPAIQKRSLQILCIDDDEQILEMMKACLGHHGHRVRVASGGKYGIELFCTAILKSEPYDVVITDLGMPDLDGYQVAWAIKIESPQTPIVMLTAWGANVRNDVAISSTVNAVVSKPPQMQELNELLLRMTG